jgi:hypothetical protein
VQIASLEIRQSRSFDDPLSTADVDGDGIAESSQSSAIGFSARVNPSPKFSFDLRGDYDILFDNLRGVTVSGGVGFSLVHRNGLGINPSTSLPQEDSLQVGFQGQLRLLQERLTLFVDTAYNSDPEAGHSHFPEQRWRLLYSTQCCTLWLDRLSRDFADVSERRDWTLRIDLRGIGKLLQQSF